MHRYYEGKHTTCTRGKIAASVQALTVSEVSYITQEDRAS